MQKKRGITGNTGMRHPNPGTLARLLMHTCDPVSCTFVDGDPVVLFCGTRGLKDVFDDLDLRPCHTFGSVHCGMYLRSKRLWNQNVHEFVTTHAQDDLHLAGWSLGGGCAVHTASLIRASGLATPHSITLFGAPRCGDEEFTSWYAREGLAARTTRYELKDDPIVTLPRGGYRHVGRRITLTSPARGGVWGQHDLSLYRDVLESTSTEE